MLLSIILYSQDNNTSDRENPIPKSLSVNAINSYSTNNYDSAIYYYQELVKLSANLNDWGKYSQYNLKISDTYYAMGLFDSSYNYASIAKSVIANRKIVDTLLIGSMNYSIGNIFTKLNSLDSAQYYLHTSASFCENGVNDSLLSLVNKVLGNINFSLRNFDKALLFYRKSLKTELAQQNPSQSLIASLNQNIGIIMSASGYADSARYYFEKSILLKERIFASDDPLLAKGYLNFGRFLQIQGDMLEALYYQDKAEKIYNEKFGSNYSGLAPIYWNKGAIYIILNDYDRALSYNERALNLYLQQFDPGHYIVSEIYLNLGLLYSTTRQYELAIEYYKRGINGNLNAESFVKAYRNLANSYLGLDQFDKAEEYYKLSIEEAVKHFGNDHFMTGDSYAAYGQFCNVLKRNRKAEKYLQNSLSIQTKYFGAKNRSVSDVLVILGNLYNSEGRYIKALESYQQALISYIDDFNDQTIYSNPTIENIDPDINIFQTLNQKSQTFFDIYIKSTNDIHDLKASLETALVAVELFESIMSSYKDEKTKIIINELNYEIYNQAVVVASELYNKTLDNKYLNLAFEFSEKGKSAVLLSSLRELEAREVGSIPDTIREFEQRLNRELSVYKNYLYDENQKNEPDSNKIASWKNIIFEKTLTYDSLIASIENNFPDYYDLKYKNEVITLNQVQAQLDEDRAFLEYKMTDSLLIVFFVSEDTIILKSKVLDNDFKDKVIEYVSSMNKFPDVSKKSESLNDFMKKSQYLFGILIDEYFPLENYSGLVIVPDNVLGYLSFETLISNKDTVAISKFKDFNYLIQSHAITYSYSGTLLFQHLLKERHHKTNYLAMAPSYLNIEQNVGDSYTSLRDIEKYLIPLQYTVDEVMNIGNVFSGKVLINSDATEANFKKNASDYAILHFAMHALINDEDPLASKLIFTLDNDTLEDGFLNTYEIYDLNLNADLAVLSACKTGVGKLSKGEGIMSLARGFLYAGVPGIVMTLWEVEDVSSVSIMNDFYLNLEKGLSKDISLRNSKLAYLNTANQLQAHPYFWAAFVQIGDNSPVTSNAKYQKFVIIGVIILFVLGALLLIRYLKTKRFKRLNQ